MRRGAGVVERGGLENRCAFIGTEGSNPSLSAKNALRSACHTCVLREGKLFIPPFVPPFVPRLFVGDWFVSLGGLLYSDGGG